MLKAYGSLARAGTTPRSVQIIREDGDNKKSKKKAMNIKDVKINFA
jgi:hypothetical protein